MEDPDKNDNILDEMTDEEAAKVSLMPEPELSSLNEDPDVAEDTDVVMAGVDEIIAERDDLKDRLLRALAENENIRKRAAKDKRDGEAYGGSRLARDLLPVYDNLQRALEAVDEHSKETASALLEGVELTQRELLNIFQKHGITRIAPEKGDLFDPQLHQAMFEAPVPDVAKGCVVQVMLEGFMLQDRLLRPAQVGVSSNA